MHFICVGECVCLSKLVHCDSLWWVLDVLCIVYLHVYVRKQLLHVCIPAGGEAPLIL